MAYQNQWHLPFLENELTKYPMEDKICNIEPFQFSYDEKGQRES
jgi:hypothetical protein